MSGECQKCGDHVVDCRCDFLKSREFDRPPALNKLLIQRLEDIGRAQEKLRSILEDELFDNLSKHDPYWNSKNELESYKLADLRGKIALLSENLWDLWLILRKDEEI